MQLLRRITLSITLCAIPWASHANGGPDTAAADAASAASPADTGFKSHGPYLKRHVTYTVNRDGTYVREYESIARADNEDGVKEWSQVRVPYSSSLQKAEVLEAYVLTSAGERIEVSPNKIFTQEPYVSQGAPMYSDYKVKTIVFPKVEPGTIVGVRVRRTQHTPELPGHFSVIEMMSPHHQWYDTRFTLIAPADMPMKVQGDGADVARSVLPDGRVQWVMNATRQHAAAPEPGSVATIDYSVRFTATSFESPADLAGAYRALVGDVLQATPKVASLADRLTRGIDDPQAQARALYDWVRFNIRYVFVGLGHGGYRPHDPDSIIDNRYGDCKDKATLLVALLNAKGIDSTPVLINSGASYWMPEPPALQSFNHMIVFVPTLDRYLDPTATYASFDTLPRENAAKPVIHVADGTSARTPMRTVEQDGVVITGQYRYSNDGRLEATFDSVARGNVAYAMRASFERGTSTPDSDFVKAVLSSAGLKGEGRLRRPDLKAGGDTASYGFDLVTSSAADFPGPNSLTVPTALLGGGIAANIGSFPDAGLLPLSCQPVSVEEKLSIELPENVPALRIAPDADERESNASFEARYVAASRIVPTGVEVARSLSFAPKGPVCAPGDMAAMREMAVRVQKNLRVPIAY